MLRKKGGQEGSGDPVEPLWEVHKLQFNGYSHIKEGRGNLVRVV